MDFFYLENYFGSKSFSMTKKMALPFGMLSLNEKIHLSHKNIFHIYIPTQNIYLYGEYALQSIYSCINVAVLSSLRENYKEPVQPEVP